jgi:hypothetical protein
VHGPDLPAASELFTVDVWQYRWPTGTEKAELYDGVLVFGGAFDQRDVEIAQRAHPGRRIVLNAGGGLEVHPSGQSIPVSIFESFRTRSAGSDEK